MLLLECKIEGVKEIKEAVSSKLFRKILSKTVFNTAYDVQKDVREEIKNVFDRPTPWIFKSVYVRSPGTWKFEKGLEVLIGIDSWGGKGQGPEEILKPHVEGGTRPMKPSERYFYKYWAPGSGAKLNKYGNITGAQITQILSYLKLFPEVGYLANITKTSRKRKKGRIRKYFITRRGNKGLIPGVWERMAGNRVKPILIFTRSPIYSKRFHFFEVVQKSIAKNVQRRFDEASRDAFIAK